ncbi:hypothetical protein Tco_1163539 [Tanacetum coccineum]
MTTKAQQIELDNALVAFKNCRFIGKCDMRINPGMKPKEPTYQVVLDALALTTCYPAFLITAEVPVIYMHQFWATVMGKEFDEPPTKEEALSFICELCHSREISQKKSESAISSAESPSKKKFAKAKKDAATKPKPTKKKAPVKADRGKGLNVLSEVALSKAAQLKEATKRSKKDFHISQASGSGDGTDFESRVPDEQHLKTTGGDEGTGTIPGVPDVPKYESESGKESWGDSGEEDEDDENDSEDKSDDGKDDDDDDANDDDNQEGDDTNDDDEETNSDRTELDRIKILVLNQSTTKYYEEEEEKIDDEETMDEEEDDEVTKELYDDVNVNLGSEDTDMTNADQGKANEPVQSSFVSSDFTNKLLNLENPSLADNEIASLMETSARHAMTVPKITSGFTTTIPPPPSFFNPLPKQATPTPTPTTSEATTSFTSLLDLSSVFKFNDKVTNLEKDLSEIKQVDQQKAQDKKNAYIELVDTSMRAIIKEEKNVIESLEAVVLTRSSSQPKNTYEAAASLSEFELTKILLDKMEESKSHFRADYKKKLYDALRSRDDRDKDQDPSARSDRGMKRRKSSKEVESSRDSRSKEKKSSSTSKDGSQSQHKHSGKSAHAEEPSHTIDDSGVL